MLYENDQERCTAMPNAANIALTALNALDTQLFITANNIANVNTDGFKKSRGMMKEQLTSGVSISPERVNTPGDIVAIEGVARESSNVLLEEELTTLMMTQNNYEANLKTLKTSDELQGTLFDILA